MVKGDGASPQFSNFQPKTDNLVLGVHCIIGQTAFDHRMEEKSEFTLNLLISSSLRGLIQSSFVSIFFAGLRVSGVYKHKCQLVNFNISQNCDHIHLKWWLRILTIKQ